ncbi:hypothetical protein P9112_009874 [Eukaryota sp. TZLM1-RC]
MSSLENLFTHLYSQYGAEKPHKLAKQTLTILQGSPNANLSIELRPTLGESTDVHVNWLNLIVSRIKSGESPDALCQELGVDPNIVQKSKKRRKKPVGCSLSERKIPPWSAIPVPPTIIIDSSKVYVNGEEISAPAPVIPAHTETTVPTPSGIDRAALEASFRASGLRLCRWWPQCRREDCSFSHPSEDEARLHVSKPVPEIPICKFYPNCAKGVHCQFRHVEHANSSRPAQPCQWGVSCQNPSKCMFSHPVRPCHYFHNSECTKGELCTYNHNPPCPRGMRCTVPMCEKSHFENPPNKISV